MVLAATKENQVYVSTSTKGILTNLKEIFAEEKKNKRKLEVCN
jgi:hypothetical protein